MDKNPVSLHAAEPHSPLHTRHMPDHTTQNQAELPSMVRQSTGQAASMQPDSAISHSNQTEQQQQHTDAWDSLIDQLLGLPPELFCEQIWPRLSLETQHALFRSCKTFSQLIASHCATRLVLPIDHYHLIRHVQPTALPRPQTARKLRALYLCFAYYGNFQGERADLMTVLQLTEQQVQLLADTLTGAVVQSDGIFDLSLSFADADLCNMLGDRQYVAPLLLTTQLLTTIISNFQNITCLTLSNFSTEMYRRGASHGEAPLSVCSLAPLQHAPNLRSLSFQQEMQGPFLTQPNMTWEFLCTLPLLLQLERLEVSSISGPVTQPFPHTLPALTHVAFTSRDKSAYSEHSQIELIRLQQSLASIDNLPEWSESRPLEEELIAGLQGVKVLTVNRFLTRNLAVHLAAVTEVTADGFGSRQGGWIPSDAEAPQMPMCTKLRILKFEIEAHQLNQILRSLPNLEHLEAPIYLCTLDDDWQTEVNAYSANQSAGFFGRLRNSSLKYLRLQLVQDDLGGEAGTLLLAEVKQIVSALPFQVDVSTTLLTDLVASRAGWIVGG